MFTPTEARHSAKVLQVGVRRHALRLALWPLHADHAIRYREPRIPSDCERMQQPCGTDMAPGSIHRPSSVHLRSEHTHTYRSVAVSSSLQCIYQMEGFTSMGPCHLDIQSWRYLCSACSHCKPNKDKDKMFESFVVDAF